MYHTLLILPGAPSMMYSATTLFHYHKNQQESPDQLQL